MIKIECVFNDNGKKLFQLINNINASFRIKSEQLREVCNDIIGIRIIVDMSREDIKANLNNINEEQI